MSEQGGFLRVRRGIFEHLANGRISYLEFAVYLTIHNLADFQTGIATTNPIAVALGCGDRDQNRIRHAMQRLKRKHYINYLHRNGSHESYAVLIDKYEPGAGKWRGCRLNAWKHKGSAIPEYAKAECPGSAGSVPAQQSDNDHNYQQVANDEIKFSARSVPAQCPEAGAYKEEELRIKKKTNPPQPPPNSGGRESRPFSNQGTEPKSKSLNELALEVMESLQLPRARSFVYDVGAAIECCARRRGRIPLEAGRDALIEIARRARLAGQELSQMWFRNPDRWEKKPKQDDVYERFIEKLRAKARAAETLPGDAQQSAA